MPSRRPLRSLAVGLGALALLSMPVRIASPQRATIRTSRPTVDSLGHPTTPVPLWSFWLQQSWAGAELLALLFAAYQLWARRGERRKAEAEAAALAIKAANYQAWTVVNSAQGKGGSGGRIDALQDLNRNEISLAGVRLDGAWLQGIALPGARLSQASLRETNLTGANLQAANLEAANLTDANLTGADLRRAFLKGADLTGVHLGTADLRGADLTELRGWSAIRAASYLQIGEIRHAPPGFRQWALEHGAIEEDAERPEAQVSFSTHFKAV